MLSVITSYLGWFMEIYCAKLVDWVCFWMLLASKFAIIMSIFEAKELFVCVCESNSISEFARAALCSIGV